MPATLPNIPPRTRVLWVSDGTLGPEDLDVLVGLKGFSLEFAPGGWEALGYLAHSRVDLLMANFPLPEWTPEELLEQVQRVAPRLPVLLRDPRGTVADAFRLAKLGADHFQNTPLDAENLRQRFREAMETRRQPNQEQSLEHWKQFLVGESRAIEDVARIIRLVGAKRCTVLITGETGTGKELVARALHLAGPRSALPMVAVNCSALPESLLEAELFGHVKGAFTGAIHNRIGRFEQAHSSTLFLDEIGDMPLELQAKLLRVLQEREFQRLGSSETVRVDVRVIAASNVDLGERVAQGRFREDLYYRLNVVPVHMPPLRERTDDIPVLVPHFIERICGAEEIPRKQVSRETLERLAAYPWPGNIRQLENAVEMAIALSGDRAMLYLGDFPLPPPPRIKSASALTMPVVPVPDGGLDFEQTVSQIERSILEQALCKTGGNKKMAATMLRLKRTTLSAKLRSLGSAGGDGATPGNGGTHAYPT